MPKLRGATFRTAVIERYRRRETSVEEAIVEMYLAGVSTRRIEDVSELPWGGAGVHREDGARRVRRDACLHGIPAGALAPDQVERRGRAHQPRDQEEDEGRRNLPGRQLDPHAGDDETEVHSEAKCGKRRCLDISKLDEMDELKGEAKGQKRMGPRTAKSICERIMTVLENVTQPLTLPSSHYDN